VRALVIGVFALLSLAGCSAPSDGQTDVSGHIVAVGSTALQPLVSRAATLYMAQHHGLTIDVQGGGSLSGLLAVTAGKSDIGDSDVYADPAVYPDPNLTDHLVCVIPFAMIVNPDVPVASLTTQQIIDIFSTGTLNNWSQLQGPDLPIVPVVRPASSGTRATFRKYLLGGRDEQGTLLQSDSSQTVLQTVGHTPGAIGYLALSVLDSSVHAIAINGVSPTAAAIASGRYAFWGFEHMYTLGQSAAAESFVDFMLTSAVQQEAQKLGYIPIATMQLGATGTPTAHNGTASAGIASAGSTNSLALRLE
jgi:phosphate transport system substrate-binding protein